ncbi:MAG TPA: GNAT family N-acetyltransferase, partial [Burkholderiales bacterium]|nr:GNAT family N-acetyltransferase [Burkholderiales bacterium]
KTGKEITEREWQFFESCYRNTYLEHLSTPYLNLDFFLKIGEAMPENLLLVVAYRAGKPVASALDFFDGERLYGRYWGAKEQHSGLHFETCYYQGLEFCIERKISVFEGGAQGGHKLARGFMPVRTWSAHWLAHPAFSRAVDEFLEREARGMEVHMAELEESAPFRRL